MPQYRAIVAGKGSDRIYSCDHPFEDGSNVLSVAFDPQSLIAYTAWESGSGADLWTPAACATYLAIDLSTWF